MNNNLQIFKNNEFGEIRVVTKDNEPWFVGKDLTDRLGYQNGSRDINRHVDEEDRITEMIAQYQNGTQLGSSKTILINESGLYSLILSSKLPTAKKFKRWVTDEVLPSIRKHGAYMTEQTLEEVLSNPDTLIRLATDLKKEREEKQKLKLENEIKEQQISELKPKADYADLILQNKGLVTINQIANDYNLTAQELNKILNRLKVQYKQSGQWLLYKNYRSKGYTHSETHNYKHKDGRPDVKMLTKWTQKGRLFLYELLKENDIYPNIEKEFKKVN